jgi:hypothetical protein
MDGYQMQAPEQSRLIRNDGAKLPRGPLSRPGAMIDSAMNRRLALRSHFKDLGSPLPGFRSMEEWLPKPAAVIQVLRPFIL